MISRHWIITDALEHIEEVQGPGVVGEQPVLAAGESFKYSSWCPLKTPTGVMHGTYQMVRANGERFDVELLRLPLRPDIRCIKAGARKQKSGVRKKLACRVDFPSLDSFLWCKTDNASDSVA